MGINLDKPKLWKSDIARSVDIYNDWFLKFAPKTYREERGEATEHVRSMLETSDHLRDLSLNELKERPAILFSLRMSTAVSPLPGVVDGRFPLKSDGAIRLGVSIHDPIGCSPCQDAWEGRREGKQPDAVDPLEAENQRPGTVRGVLLPPSDSGGFSPSFTAGTEQLTTVFTHGR